MANQRLTILQINDTHAYLNEHWELFRSAAGDQYEMVGGFARIKSYFDRVRAECGADSVLAFDNGDTLHGTYPAVNSKGEALIEPLNRLQLDAATMHWDYVYGTKQILELANKLNYPLLACNCYREQSNELVFPATAVFERRGVRIGVIGICAFIIGESFPPEVSEGVYFTLGREELPRHIKRLHEEEKVDLIVVLSHLGFPQDCQLAAETNGIDVLLSGHTHNRVQEPVKINGATIIQSGCHGSFVGRLNIELSDGKISKVKHGLVVMNAAIERDAAMQRDIDEIYSASEEILRRVVGGTKCDLNRYAALESTMDNLLLDAIAEAAGTEIAFSNGWRYGAPIPAGPITVNELWNIIPTNPPVSVVEMTGQEMRTMMEENLERTYARDPFEQMGGYVKRCRGINIYCKIENSAGNRIQEFFVQDKPLILEKTHRAAFVTQQGLPKKFGRNRKNLKLTAIQALENYLKTHSPVDPQLRNSITIV